MLSFFSLSKWAGLLLTPSNALMGGAALLWLAGWLIARWRRACWRISAALCGLLALIGLLPVGDWLLTPLERAYPPLAPAALTAPTCASGQPVEAIVLLGGAIGSMASLHGETVDLNDGADRLTHAAELAKALPALPVWLSGGQVFAKAGRLSEAERMRQTLLALGIDDGRLRLEQASRTTSENAREIIVRLRARDPAKEPAKEEAAEADSMPALPVCLILVTSGYHMPRSLASFEAFGAQVIPAPTDWRVQTDRAFLATNVAANLIRVDVAVREYLGLLAYRLAGRAR